MSRMSMIMIMITNTITTTTTTTTTATNKNNNNTSIPSRQLASARMSPTTSASNVSSEHRDFDVDHVVDVHSNNVGGVNVNVGVGVHNDVTKKLSIAEVMELVAAGKELPGCRKVVVEVQDDVEPSPSVLQKPLKPWEAKP
eukprot:m.97286 g.97286  ORF g.97286 m.97286 type:complete len:141 (+) comp26963_c0_seq2:2101-2523(+)